MSNEPSISGKQMIRSLSRHGFDVLRVKGSHHFMSHPDGRSTIVPVHSNEDLGKGLLRKILRDCEITFSELLVKS